MDDLDPSTFDDSGDVERDWGGDDEDGGGEASVEAYRTGEFAGKITNTSGDVSIKRSDGSVHRAKQGDILIKGDIIRTGNGSRVDFREPQGSRVRLGSNSAIDTDSGRSKRVPGATVGVKG